MTSPVAPEKLLGQGRPPDRKRILVVDDEPEVRAVLTEYLSHEGFEALGVASGEEALDRIPDLRPHLVLLDIRMPGLSGVETLRRIKTLSQPPPVVIVSGIGDLDTAQRTLAMGAADYVTKPFDLQYLDSVLEILLFG